MIKIKTPYWATRSIGIAEYLLGAGENEFEILFKQKDGTRMFPDVYTVTKMTALTYPTTTVKGIRLRMIPINELRKKILVSQI